MLVAKIKISIHLKCLVRLSCMVFDDLSNAYLQVTTQLDMNIAK
jgi:hypothetical protein